MIKQGGKSVVQPQLPKLFSEEEMQIMNSIITRRSMRSFAKEELPYDQENCQDWFVDATFLVSSCSEGISEKRQGVSCDKSGFYIVQVRARLDVNKMKCVVRDGALAKHIDYQPTEYPSLFFDATQ